jgi:hypothetical protein
MKSRTSLSKNNYIFGAVVGIVFILINIYSLFYKDIFVDEAISINIVQRIPLSELVKGVDNNYGYYIIMKLLPHPNVWVLRGYSLIIMSIAIFLFYIFMVKMRGRSYAMLLSAIIVLSMTISEYATQARQYSILFLISVIYLYCVYKKNYLATIVLAGVACFFHYYALFLFLPLGLMLFYEKNWRILLLAVLVGIFTVVLLAPIVGNQLFGENPYDLPPPHDAPNLYNSLPSMILFPFAIASKITGIGIFIIAIAVIAITLYLIIFYREDDKRFQCFISSSLLTALLIFLLAYLFHIPYHHRYLIPFLPMFYYVIVTSLIRRHGEKSNITLIIIFFIAVSSVGWHLHPEVQLQNIAKMINCPANVLHETPFSYIPMAIYLPNCSHYMAKSSDWKGLDYRTLYATPDKVNNPNVTYSYYLHYFEENKASPELLALSPNVTLIKIVD